MAIRTTILTTLFLSLLFLISCTPASINTFESLLNKGMLPLSPDNGYVGSNLFLSQEFSKSTHLFNFLKARGAPLAIQLNASRFGSPELSMYYPMDKEYYIADLVKDDLTYQWITRGPFRIERKDYREISRSTSDLGEPLFVYRGQPFQFKKKPEPTPTPTIAPSPTATPKPKKKKIATSSTPVITGPAATPTPDVWKPLNADQQALLMSQGFAERAQNGDVIHTITSDGQTIEKISEWYTGNASNASAIRQANALSADGAPKIGTRIQIPLSMIKQYRVLR